MIEEIRILFFRNLEDISLKFSEKMNFLFGCNGSGKTSFLEAIYFLAIGRSFRANSFKKVINFNSEHFVISAKLKNKLQQYNDNFQEDSFCDPVIDNDNKDGKNNNEINFNCCSENNLNCIINSNSSSILIPNSNSSLISTISTPTKTLTSSSESGSNLGLNSNEKSNFCFSSQLGIEKFRNGSTILKINSQKVLGFSEIAKFFPVLLMNDKSYLLLEGEPFYRRRFLDWILFHVEPTFLKIWKNFKKTLVQRNAAIKAILENSMKLDVLDYWDVEYIIYAKKIDDLRRKFLDKYKAVFNEVLHDISNLKKFSFDLVYKNGWKKEKTLDESIKLSREQDFSMKTTSQGPHRADLIINVNEKLAKFVLSRGQIKLLVFALNLARAKLLEQYTDNKKSLFLFDDVCSELDDNASKIIFNELKNSKHQVIFTGLTPFPFYEENKKNIKLFHVEHGKIFEK